MPAGKPFDVLAEEAGSEFSVVRRDGVEDVRVLWNQEARNISDFYQLKIIADPVRLVTDLAALKEFRIRHPLDQYVGAPRSLQCPSALQGMRRSRGSRYEPRVASAS